MKRGFDQAFIDIQAFFNIHWKNKTPVSWLDVHFNPPDASWVRFTMDNVAGYQASIGSPKANLFRRDGIIIIQVFGKPKNAKSTGAAEARALAETVSGIFINERLSGITFSNVNVKNVGKDDSGKYQYNVTANYKYDTIA